MVFSFKHILCEEHLLQSCWIGRTAGRHGCCHRVQERVNRQSTEQSPPFCGPCVGGRRQILPWSGKAAVFVCRRDEVAT